MVQFRGLGNHVSADEGPCFTAEWHRQCVIQAMMERTGNAERQHCSHQLCYWRCCELLSPLPVLFALGNTAFCTFEENRSSNMVLQVQLQSYMLSVVSGNAWNNNLFLHTISVLPSCVKMACTWGAKSGLIFLPLHAVLSWLVQPYVLKSNSCKVGPFPRTVLKAMEVEAPLWVASPLHLL